MNRAGCWEQAQRPSAQTGSPERGGRTESAQGSAPSPTHGTVKGKGPRASGLRLLAQMSERASERRGRLRRNQM